MTRLISSESQAQRFFKRLAGDKPLSFTRLRHSRVPLKTWIMALKLFELQLSIRKAAQELGINYKTAARMFMAIRKTIVRHDLTWTKMRLTGEVEIDEAYFGGKRKGKRGRGSRNKIPVLGLLERNGKVRIEILPNVTSKTLTRLVKKNVSPEATIFSDKFRGYNALIVQGYKHIRIDHNKHFSNGKAYINTLEGFWSFAKERMAKYHGVSPENFYLYLKEMEFRYNHRHHPSLFSLLAKYLVS